MRQKGGIRCKDYKGSEEMTKLEENIRNTIKNGVMVEYNAESEE